jgi:hypothetical protein
MRLDEVKLPGQDSNLDKENQNLFASRCKSGHASTSGKPVQRRVRALYSAAKTDADLQRILTAWPELTPPIRAAVLALIDTATRRP